MKIMVPVECQNGHRATAFIEIEGLETRYLGVPHFQNCDCPKADFGQGWKAVGPPEPEYAITTWDISCVKTRIENMDLEKNIKAMFERVIKGAQDYANRRAGFYQFEKVSSVRRDG